MGCGDSTAAQTRTKQQEAKRNSSALDRVLYGSHMAAKWKRVVAERNAAKSYDLTEKSLQANESTFRFKDEKRMSKEKDVKNTSRRKKKK